MNKRKKILIGSFIGAMSVVAVCVCAFVSTNMFNKADISVQVPIDAASQNNEASSNFKVSTENAVEPNGSPQIRYVENSYSPEVVESMHQIQNSFNQRIVEDNKPKDDSYIYGAVEPSALSFCSSNAVVNTNKNATDAKVSWEFDNGTLFIGKSGTYDNESDTDKVPAWKTNTDTYDFFKVEKVEITAEINPAACLSWFGAYSQHTSGKVPLPNITSIEGLSNIDMTGVEDAGFMFTGCDLLQNVNENNMPKNMGDLTNIDAMFALTTMFDSSAYSYASSQFKNIAKGQGAFGNNSNVSELDVSNWVLSSSSDINHIFCNDENITTIKAKEGTDWATSSAKATDMFKGCVSLKGGAGTKYSTGNDGIEFAHNDGLDSKPGYFSPGDTPSSNWVECSYEGNSFFPVFNDDKHPANVKFGVGTSEYDVTEYSTMNELGAAIKEKGYAKVYYQYESDDASFNAVRSVYGFSPLYQQNGTSYDDVYGVDAPSVTVNPVYKDGAWYKAYVKDGETVEGLSKNAELDPGTEPTPEIYGVNLINIWKAYNPDKTEEGFGFKKGVFWSCVSAPDAEWGTQAHCFGCNFGYWDTLNRRSAYGSCVCISYVFDASKPAIMKIKPDSSFDSQTEIDIPSGYKWHYSTYEKDGATYGKLSAVDIKGLGPTYEFKAVSAYPGGAEEYVASINGKDIKESDTINISGILSCKYEVPKKHIDNYSLDELKVISDDISANGTASAYWNEFNGYIENDEIWYGSKGTYVPQAKVVTDNMKQYCCSFITDAAGKPVEDNVNNYLFLRVIGINHDYKAGSKIDHAGLTFQVVHALPQAYTMGTGDNQWWNTGSLRAKMQDSGDIYSKLNSKFTDNITAVDKYSQQDRDSEANIAITTDKMFLPSYGEMWQINGDYYVSRRSWYNNGRNEQGEQIFNPSLPTTEGYCYEWHWNKKINGRASNLALEGAIYCNDGKFPAGCNDSLCYERSVYYYESSDFFGLDPLGDLAYSPNAKYQFGVRPCFCF